MPTNGANYTQIRRGQVAGRGVKRKLDWGEMREEVGEQNPDENTRDAPSENGGGEGRRGALRSHRCFILNGEKWLITWEKYQTGYRVGPS